MTKSKGIQPPRHKYTDEETETIRTRYPHERTQDIADDLGLTRYMVYRKAQAFGLKKTPEYLSTSAACRINGLHPESIKHRFKKGLVPHNKGVRMPGWAPGRMRETQFKKGHKPHTWVPIGSERTTIDGYVEVKIADTGCTRRDFVGVHHLVWELHHGAIPEKHHVVFKNGDRQNTAPENLEAVSRAEMMRRNSLHRYPKEVVKLIQLNGALQRKINERSKEDEPK